MGSHFYFSTGAFSITSVDPPFKESTDPGLSVLRNDQRVLHNVAECVTQCPRCIVQCPLVPRGQVIIVSADIGKSLETSIIGEAL